MGALAFCAVAAGCITHLPPRTTTHLQIHWQPDYETAQHQAQAAGKPLLVLLVAGEIAGPC
jgi:hypothetical protein